MKKGTGYATFNAPRRSWTLTKMTQRFTSNMFSECCCIPCYTKMHSDISKGGLKEKDLQDVSCDKVEDQVEMEKMALSDSSRKKEIVEDTDDDLTRINQRNDEESSIHCTDSTDEIFTSSVKSFSLKRFMKNFPAVSKTEIKDSDGESIVSEMFPKCRVTKAKERNHSGTGSENDTS